ncbi:hypothetical protein K8F61_05145 [Microbacterium resistens]|uniref:Phage tail protein n=1 Tax=Microbacterium resistens TaxID=156977 RepID=A0ABY3RUM2_9MICO|nr:hypothetical protein [Microbacterium resistens]UGS27576.1 hypothetical protein K8F61_05145 [Microbacterium resistens]
MSRPYGLFVRKDGFQGWQGLPAGRREALARAVQHGEFDVPVFLPSRVVTIDGWVIAPSEFELGKLSDSVAGIGATGPRMTVTIEHQGNLRRAYGRRILAECDDKGIRFGRYLRAEFQVQLVFADPRKYGDTAVLPGDRLAPPSPSATATVVDVFSYGNFPAFPVVEIPNAPAGYTITSSAGTFTVSGATAGGTHTVDLRNGRVRRNGTEMPGVGRGDLWAVPPREPMKHTLSVPGRVRITDTDV